MLGGWIMMKLHPFALAVVFSSLAVAPYVGAADEVRSKPIRMLIGYAPGGGADVVARYMSPKLSASLGQPIIVDNRSGANGNIATATLAKAEPDGATIMLGAIGQLSLAP